MSVQNGKVYPCVIIIVLDDLFLLKYCVNNRIHGVKMGMKMTCDVLRFGRPSKSFFSQNKYKTHFHTVES